MHLLACGKPPTGYFDQPAILLNHVGDEHILGGVFKFGSLDRAVENRSDLLLMYGPLQWKLTYEDEEEFGVGIHAQDLVKFGVPVAIWTRRARSVAQVLQVRVAADG